MKIREHLEQTEARLERIRRDEYLRELVGTIGADPLRPARSEV